MKTCALIAAMICCAALCGESEQDLIRLQEIIQEIEINFQPNHEEANTQIDRLIRNAITSIRTDILLSEGRKEFKRIWTTKPDGHNRRQTIIDARKIAFWTEILYRLEPKTALKG